MVKFQQFFGEKWPRISLLSMNKFCVNFIHLANNSNGIITANTTHLIHDSSRSDTISDVQNYQRITPLEYVEGCLQYLFVGSMWTGVDEYYAGGFVSFAHLLHLLYNLRQNFQALYKIENNNTGCVRHLEDFVRTLRNTKMPSNTLRTLYRIKI